MAWRTPDERQGDLFGAPPPPARTRLRRRARKPDDTATITEPENVEALAQRLSRAEIDELFVVLPDDILADAVLAGTRELKRRAAREARQHRARRGPMRSSSLTRTTERIAAEWARGGHVDDDEF